MIALLVIIAFVVGFFVGVFERKIDRLKINTQTVTRIFEKQSNSEVLVTPSQEELDKEEAVEFYEKIV